MFNRQQMEAMPNCLPTCMEYSELLNFIQGIVHPERTLDEIREKVGQWTYSDILKWTDGGMPALFPIPEDTTGYIHYR